MIFLTIKFVIHLPPILETYTSLVMTTSDALISTKICKNEAYNFCIVERKTFDSVISEQTYKQTLRLIIPKF